ncbi:MAG: hypothetical protein WBQ23_12590 [Bacteroidota bacterium]
MKHLNFTASFLAAAAIPMDSKLLIGGPNPVNLAQQLDSGWTAARRLSVPSGLLQRVRTSRTRKQRCASWCRIGTNGEIHCRRTIAYELKEGMEDSLRVMDVFCREIRQLETGYRAAGRHESVFDADNLPSGVYFYQVSTPAGSSIKHMLLLR